MKTKSTVIHLHKNWIWLLLLLLVLLMARLTHTAIGQEPTSANPITTPGNRTPLSIVSPPTDHNTPQFWPEHDFPAYPYCSGSYPDYAVAYPDAPCATWENGGLTWSYLNELTGWGTVVWLPVHRFCGIP